MYFPYLRGRQFELVALRELLELNLISDKIIPVVEPVKDTPSLLKTLQTYVTRNRNLFLIQNPKVGSYEGTTEISSENSENIINTYFLDNSNKNNVPNNVEQAIILEKPDCLDAYFEKYEKANCKFTFISPYKELEREIENNRIMVANRFNSKEKNADYTNETDEFFSSDHLYYEKEGYIGFSDYSVIGDKYTEGGFAPYAVAIHIVYFDDKQRLRVRHFVSNSNLDYTNTPGKLKEALDKLIEWNQKCKYNTYGIKQFEEMHSSGKYPGLGSIKKLSIMHHIELMNKYLSGESYSDILQ